MKKMERGRKEINTRGKNINRQDKKTKRQEKGKEGTNTKRK